MRQQRAMAGVAATRLLRWIGAGFLVLLLLLAGVLYWLLATGSGARFVLARATAATEGRLSVEHAQGTLSGPLLLQGLRWRDPAAGVDARVGRIQLDITPLALFSRRVDIDALAIADVDVALVTVPEEPTPPSEPLSLQAPIDVFLDGLVLQRARVTQDGEPVFALDRLDLAGAWTQDGAVIRTLALRAPDGRVDLHGTISTQAGYPGKGEATFRWTAGERTFAGRLTADGDGRAATLDATLSEPVVATLAANLTQSAELPWTARIGVPPFDAAQLLPGSTLGTLALDLQGSGDRRHGNLAGTLGIQGHVVRLDPLRYALEAGVLDIEALSLTSPDAAGRLDASGRVQLDATPPSATLALSWTDVELPADLVGQPLASHGRLDASGSADAYHASGAFALGPPGQLSDIELALDGTPAAITLHRLALRQADGGLEAQGSVALQPETGWDISARARHFNPGAFAPDWPGALDFQLATAGTLTDKGPDATLQLTELGGTLRQRALSGHADLAIKPGYVVDGTLALASGNSRLDVTGSGGGEGTDARVKLAIASLGDWLPDGSGQLDGDFHLHGAWPHLAIDGTADARDLGLGTTGIATLHLDAAVSDTDPLAGRLAIAATGVATAGLAFDTLAVRAQGNRAAHELQLEATGEPLDVRLALGGQFDGGGRWNGTLRRLDLDVTDAPPLALEAPAPLGWKDGRFDASTICLAGDGPRLCLGGSANADGSLAASYRLEHLPLALVARLAAPEAPLAIEGELGGAGDIRRSAAGALDGQATISSPAGSITYTDRPERPLLAYDRFELAATLSPQSTHATVHAGLGEGGRLDGNVTLAGPPGGAQALSGTIDAELANLGFVELLTTELVNASGRLSAHYALAGTTSAPRLAGDLRLEQFAGEVPAAGIRLKDGNIRVHASDMEHFTLEGTLSSGEGRLVLSGSGGMGPTAPLDARIQGEGFLAADIPAAHVVISPDITLKRDSERFTIGGSVTIPEANVDLAKLPGGGVSKASPDVVVVDADQPEADEPLPVVVSMTVKLGDAVKLHGMGLDGSVAGQLHVEQHPGRLATGTGTLNVTGTYKAYGQNLTIESGRLLFAGTALDNPGLDIRAARTILGSSQGTLDDSITAGLQIRGTAQVPVLTVYSKPTMQQSEALSYLITGKPLSGLESGEGDLLGSAARALGSASGGLLAKSIGARTGLDASVTDSAALGGAAFTVGKYLSPKLYLSYGVGLFSPGEVITLRYLFNKRFSFEAQNATTGNRAGVNYRLER
jgi:translocation and assembly module TamB